MTMAFYSGIDVTLSRYQFPIYPLTVLNSDFCQKRRSLFFFFFQCYFLDGNATGIRQSWIKFPYIVVYTYIKISIYTKTISTR